MPKGGFGTARITSCRGFRQVLSFNNLHGLSWCLVSPNSAPWCRVRDQSVITVVGQSVLDALLRPIAAK